MNALDTAKKVREIVGDTLFISVNEGYFFHEYARNAVYRYNVHTKDVSGVGDDYDIAFERWLEAHKQRIEDRKAEARRILGEE